MCPDGQAGVEQEHAAVGPGCQETAFVGRRLEAWVVDFEAFVDVLQGWRSGCGWADGKAEAVGLIHIVVGVLAEDDGFDGREGGVTGPEWCQWECSSSMR